MLTTEVKAKARPQVMEKMAKFLGVSLLAAIIPMLIVMIATIVFTAPLLAVNTSDPLQMVPLFIGFFAFTTVSGLFIISPIAFGTLRCYYDMQKTGDFKVSTVFSGFSSINNAMISIKHSLINSLIILIPVIGLMLLTVVVILIIPVVYPLVFIVSMIAFTLWIIIFDFKSYVVYFYIFDELDKNTDEKISVRAEYKKVFKDFKGYNKEILYFSFSFILWSFLSFIPFIGSIAILVFVNPYMILSYTHLVEKIRAKDTIDGSGNFDDIVDYADKSMDNTQVQEKENIVLENDIEILEIDSTKVNLEEINLKISNENDTDESKD